MSVWIDLLPASLLGRDVVARPEHGPRLGHTLHVERARDPEVRHLRLAVFVEEHVLRLHVAVDEPAVVRERERPRDLEREADRVAHLEGAVPRQVLEVRPVDVLEDNELPPVLLASVDDRHDVRVGELCDGTGLATKALDVVVVAGVLLVEDLERDSAFEKPVVRAEDVRHPARADQLLQLVPTRDELSHHGVKFS